MVFAAAPSTSGTGCDVLVQSEDDETCQGFTGIPVPRPVRILVRSGSTGSGPAARALVDALTTSMRSLGEEV